MAQSSSAMCRAKVYSSSNIRRVPLKPAAFQPNKMNIPRVIAARRYAWPHTDTDIRAHVCAPLGGLPSRPSLPSLSCTRALLREVCQRPPPLNWCVRLLSRQAKLVRATNG